MGLRETANQHKTTTSVVAAVVAVLACVWIVQQARDGGRGVPTKELFTTDEGQTWFSDSATKVPPFDHDGAQAVKCSVYQSGSGTKFVALMTKYSDAAKAKLEQAAQQGGLTALRSAVGEVGDSDIFYKRPGDKDWTKANSPHVAASMAVRAPDGSAGPYAPVLP